MNLNIDTENEGRIWKMCKISLKVAMKRLPTLLKKKERKKIAITMWS